MVMTILSHKILLQPTPTQAEWLISQCHYERWCYNKTLEYFIGGLNDDYWMNKFELAKVLRQNRPEWTKPRWAKASEQAANRLGSAIKAWRNEKQVNHRFPSFKKKRRLPLKCSFYASIIKYHPTERKVRVPKLGWVRMRELLRFTGKLVGNATVSFDGRRWWISLTVDTGEVVTPKQGDHVVGVDVGLKTLAVTSDGIEYANPRSLAGALGELRSLDKAIARSKRVHGTHRASNRRNRLYALRRKAHEKVANIRRNAHRQAASAIAKAADVMCVESLNVLGMVRNRRLARAISDAGLGGLLQELVWQCKKRGVTLIEASAWFASSKTCSSCGMKRDTLTLSEREFVCPSPSCGLVIERDLNAALNLKQLAINIINGSVPAEAWSGSKTYASEQAMMKRESVNLALS